MNKNTYDIYFDLGSSKLRVAGFDKKEKNQIFFFDKNCLSNLKWGTPSENSQDTLKHRPELRQPNKGNQKYSNEVIQEIREWHKEGASNKDIREMYEISKAHVSYIINHRTRKGV